MELRRMMNMQFRARTCIYVITSLNFDNYNGNLQLMWNR